MAKYHHKNSLVVSWLFEIRTVTCICRSYMKLFDRQPPPPPQKKKFPKKKKKIIKKKEKKKKRKF